MEKFQNFKLEKIDSMHILKDIEYQFAVNLNEYKKVLPEVYLVYKNTKSIAVVSKLLITPIGLAYTLTKSDINNLKLFQYNLDEI